MDIKLFKLSKHPCYLPPQVARERTLAPAGDSQYIVDWWVSAEPKFKETVLSERETAGSIEAVGVIIEKLDDVTIFSHEFNEKFNRHTNPQVIANRDIVEVLSLKETNRKPTSGDMVCTRWIDASHNNTPATIDEIRNVKGTMDIAQLGFFMHGDEERVIVGGTRDLKCQKYSYLGAIPTINITKTTVLDALI